MTSLAQAVNTALIDFLWQGAAVAAVFGLAMIAMRRASARSRYAAGCLALFVMVSLPFASAWLAYGRAGGGAGIPSRNWTLLLWLSGVVLFSLRPIWSLLRVRTLRRSGTKAESWILEIGTRIANRMGVFRPFEIRMSSILETAAVVGWLRPVVLLPLAAVAGLTVEQLEALLAHEIAHIRRHDYLINLAQVFVETLLFYHPAVWWVSAQIRGERELCCDDAVVALTGDAVGYAKALLVLEKLRDEMPSLAMGSTGGQLGFRVRRLVGETPGTAAMSPIVLALAMTLACTTAGDRKAEAPKNSVTLQVKYDDQGAVNEVHVVNGPAYLRPKAIESAMRQPTPGLRSLTRLGGEPNLPRVETLTFPAAFTRWRKDRQLLRQFFEDEANQAEQNLASITGHSAADERNRTTAQEKLQEVRQKQHLVRAHSPETEWEAQILQHELTEFQVKHRDELRRGDPTILRELDQKRRTINELVRQSVTESR